MTDQTNAELAQLRGELQVMNKSLERIVNDHEVRLRNLEEVRADLRACVMTTERLAVAQEKAAARQEKTDQEMSEARGAVKAMRWVLGLVGFPTVAAVIVLVGKQFH